MKTHLKTHQEKPFKCGQNDCDQAFHSLSLLKGHKMNHLAKDIFSCNICPKKFKAISSLRKHEQLGHNLQKIYVCVHCQKGFSSLDSRLKHKREHTNKPRFNWKGLQTKVLNILDV
jgi:KRAB domain-containing zinc finger protein